jgi:membrane-associated phospholipid phosphatase
LVSAAGVGHLIFCTMTAFTFWHLLTRLGEAQILLPAALLALIVLLRHAEGRLLAVWWMALLGIATLLTLFSKVAFIGWGWGMASLNFTGVSGHAMVAAAVYPLMLATLAAQARSGLQNMALALGCALALAVGVSRVVVDAHSVSEVIAGLWLGGLASGLAWRQVHMPRARFRPVVAAVVALWLAVMPLHAPASQSHEFVTRLALKLSGHSVAYTRRDMLRSARASWQGQSEGSVMSTKVRTV